MILNCALPLKYFYVFVFSTVLFNSKLSRCVAMYLVTFNKKLLL